MNILKNIMPKEKYYLYLYKKSLENKHMSSYYTDVDALMNTVFKEVKNPDVSEIRVTDTGDDLVLHWKEEEGILYPEELKNHDKFALRPKSERKDFPLDTRLQMKCQHCGTMMYLDEAYSSMFCTKEHADEARKVLMSGF